MDAMLPPWAEALTSGYPAVVTALAATGLLLAAAVVWLLRVPSHLHGLKGWSAYQSLHALFVRKWPFMVTHKEMLKELKPSNGLFRTWFMGHNVVVFGPEHLKRILTDTKTYVKSTNTTLTESDLGRWFGKSVLMVDGAHWRLQRKVCTPAFHHDNLRSLPLACTASVNQVVDLLGACPGQVVNVPEVMSRMTLDVLGLTVFGHDFDSLRNPHSATVATYHRILKELLLPKRFLFGRLVKYFDRAGETALRRDIAEFDEFIYSMIRKKQDQVRAGVLPETPDLLDMMIRSTTADNENLQMTATELRDNVLTFFIAGHDTTASALSYVLWHLAYHPEIQKKAQAEADAVPEGPMTFETQGNLPYLTMVIKESMRRIPSVPSLDRVADENTELGGVPIPKGSVVSMSIAAAHWNEEVWPNPGAFIPERFDPKTVAEEKRHPFAYLPFLAGPRVCMGMNFSMIEQRVFLAATLKRYTVRPGVPGTTVDSLRFKQDAISEASNCFLVFEPRGPR